MNKGFLIGAAAACMVWTPPAAGGVTEGTKMLNVASIVAQLADRKATVGRLAATMGRLGERLGAEYRVDTGLNDVEVAIGVDNRGTPDAAPAYVQIFWRPTQTQTVAQAVPSCLGWVLRPTNPDVNFHHYSCHPEGPRTGVDVVLLCDLSGEISDPASRIVALLLQRNVWDEDTRHPISRPDRSHILRADDKLSPVKAADGDGIVEHPRRAGRRTEPILNVETIAEALGGGQISVEALAWRLGKVTNKGVEDYRTKPSDTRLIEIAVAIPEGGNAESYPDGVQLYFTPESRLTVAEIEPRCAGWKRVATNPGASPHLYTCRYRARKGSPEVQLFAYYSDEMRSATAHLVKLLLRRDAF